VGAATGAQYTIAVTEKQQSQQKLEGQQSLSLIQSAAPELATSGSVGTKLNFTA
jgi:hypothetical protein